MSKKVLIFLICLAIAGCNTSIQPPIPPANFEGISANATQIAVDSIATETIRVLTQTATDEVVNTVPPTDVDSQVMFRDDFQVQLGNDWQWVNENPIDWSLSTMPGFLTIDLKNGYFNLGTAKNVLLRSAPDGDFIIEASLLFDPDQSAQFAGLVALDSNQNFVQAGIGYCPQILGCVGQGFYVDIYQNGNLTLPRNTFQLFTERLLIQLIFRDGILSVFTSSDNVAWYRIFEREMNFEISQVGLIAAQNDHEENIISVSFDYFEIRTVAP